MFDLCDEADEHADRSRPAATAVYRAYEFATACAMKLGHSRSGLPLLARHGVAMAVARSIGVASAASSAGRRVYVHATPHSGGVLFKFAKRH